jgi:hypothetical protein
MHDSRKTWAGTRGDIDRAIAEAAAALDTWSRYGVQVNCRIVYRSGLTERKSGIDCVQQIHNADLPEIEDLTVNVSSPDLNAYFEARNRDRDQFFERVQSGHAAAEDYEELPQPPSARVEFRFSRLMGSALSIEVEGPARDRVEGLHSRLAQILYRRQSFKRVNIDAVVWGGAPLLALVGLVLGLAITRWFHWSHRDGRWEWTEGVGMAVGAVTGLAFVAALRVLVPQLEILDDGERTRAERFGKWVLGAATGVVVGIVAAAIYGA